MRVWEGREQGEKKERAFQAAKGRPLGQEGIIPGSHELQSPEETDQGRSVSAAEGRVSCTFTLYLLNRVDIS